MDQQRKIRSRIPDVVEALIAKGLAKAVQFVARREIRLAVAGQHSVEKTEMVRNALCQRLVGSGRQVDAPSLSSFGFQILDQLAVVRQVADIEGDTLSDFGFHTSLAMQKPAREPQQSQRLAARKDKE